MTHIIREHCCLILDHNTLSQADDFYKGTFIPVNDKTINWLSKFDIFVKNKIQENGYAVEIGPNNPETRNTPLTALATLGNVDETLVGLFILSTHRISGTNSYSVTFKLSGPKSEAVTSFLISGEPFYH